MSKKTRIYFRVDGNHQIGLGHIYRSLALVDMLKDDFECFFIIRNPLKSLEDKIQKNARLIALPSPISDEQEANYIVKKYLTGKEIVVLDGYHFVTRYQQIITQKGSKLICIDDIYAYHFIADIVINHAGGLSEHLYSKEFYTQCYLGLEYLLLQSNFLKVAREEQSGSKEDNIFVCMGGADANNDTLKVLKTIENRSEPKGKTCYVVLGPAYLYQEALQKFMQTSNLNVIILSNLSADKMLDYMKLCSMAVCPPSTVSFEYLCTKGTLYLYQTADNQKDVKAYLLTEKLAIDFKENFPTKPVISANRTMKIDGKSSDRLLALFKKLENELYLNYEEAFEKHLMQYFKWANEPVVRKNAFNTSPISLETHTNWFEDRIKSTNSLLLYFYNQEQPIGQVRLDKNTDGVATIGYSVDVACHSKGYGKAILKLTILYAQEKKFCNRFLGKVKGDNIPSQKIFQKLSFEENFNEEENCYVYRLDNSK
jgi:UDP-2,4-diacetamido-2,4,6-trideoxy-beta-L-altropyranose hydrolase